MRFAVKNQSPLAIFYGNVLLQETYGALCQGKIHKCPNDVMEFFALFRMLVDWLP